MWTYYVPLLTILASPSFAIDVSESVYFANLATNLTAAGLNLFANALTVANTTQVGQDLLGNLYKDDKSYTIYAPIDAVSWTGGGAVLAPMMMIGVGSQRPPEPSGKPRSDLSAVLPRKTSCSNGLIVLKSDRWSRDQLHYRYRGAEAAYHLRDGTSHRHRTPSRRPSSGHRPRASAQRYRRNDPHTW